MYQDHIVCSRFNSKEWLEKCDYLTDRQTDGLGQKEYIEEILFFYQTLFMKLFIQQPITNNLYVYNYYQLYQFN